MSYIQALESIKNDLIELNKEELLALSGDLEDLQEWITQLLPDADKRTLIRAVAEH